MKKLLLLFALIPGISNGTTTTAVTFVDAQQAIISINTTQATCTIAISTSPTYSPVINDVNEILFPGSSQCFRGSTAVRSFVTGKRKAELSTFDNLRDSRSLQIETPYYYQVTAGTETVTGTFVTGTIKYGNTYNDQKADLTRPGEYGYPSIDGTKIGLPIIDPYTGISSIPSQKIADHFYSNDSNTFYSYYGVPTTGWTITGSTISYTGTTQNKFFLQPSANLPNGTLYDLRAPISAQLIIKASGTASGFNVCLTKNGVTCSGATLTQAITSTPTFYTIGSTVPFFSQWRNSPIPPINARDVFTRQGTLTVGADSQTITGPITGFQYNNYTFNPFWTSSSTIFVNGSTYTLASVTNETQMKINGIGPTPGNYSWTASNFGFLIWNASASNTTIVITTASYTMGFTGTDTWPPSSSFRICSDYRVTSGTGEQGYVCKSQNSNCAFGQCGGSFYFIGDSGTVNHLGNDTGLVNGSLVVSAGSIFGSTPGSIYSYGSLAAKAAIYAINYTGDYSSATTTDAYNTMLNSSATLLTPDIIKSIYDYDNAFDSGTYTNMSMANILPVGSSGTILGNTVINQNSEGWYWAFDPATKSVSAAASSFNGPPGTPDRWAGIHFTDAQLGSPWMGQNNESLSVIGYSVVTSTSLSAAPYSICPANAIDPAVVGLSSCSFVTIDSSMPYKNGVISNTLRKQSLAAGDAAMVFNNGNSVNERVIFLSVSSSTAVIERCVDSFNWAGCGLHSGVNTLETAAGGIAIAWWNIVDDPHGLGLIKSYGSTLFSDPLSNDCHEVLGQAYTLIGCTTTRDYVYNGYYFRPGTAPSNVNDGAFQINEDAGFAGNNYTVDENYNNLHPTDLWDKSYGLDSRSYKGDANICNSFFGGCFNVSGTTYIYKSSATTVAAMDYRRQPYMVTSGEYIFADASPGPLTDTTADNYKFCKTIVAGDCYAGSSVGDVFVNAPSVVGPYQIGSFLEDHPVRDLSISQFTHTLGTENQFIVNRSDVFGFGVRRIATSFAPLRLQSNFWSSRSTKNNLWLWTNSAATDFGMSQVFISKLPQRDDLDSKNRTTFIPVDFKLSGSTGDTVRIRYGYEENGTPSNLYCTPRKVSCATDGTGTQPFLWTDETQQYKACGSSGCTVTMNVLPGHVAYYVIDRKNGSNTVSGPMQVLGVD